MSGKGTLMSDNKSERLDSWKRIARYLGKGERTVRRWEREEGLPVRRLAHGKSSSVYALTQEIDDWMRSRSVASNQPALEISAAARQHYEKGLYQLNQPAAGALQLAIEDFNKAIAEAPEFAVAYARKAEALLLLSIFGIETPNECMPEALQAVARGLSAEPNSAVANAALGVILTCYSFDWAGAESALDKAIAADPKLAAAHQWRAELMAVLGRFDEADDSIEAAIAIEPASITLAGSKGYVLCMSRRYEALIDEMTDLLARHPYFPLAYINLGLAHIYLGDTKKAISIFAHGIDATGGFQDILSLYGYSLGRDGQTDKVQQVRKKLQKAAGNRMPNAVHLGLLDLSLGEYESALTHMEKAYEERFWHVVMCGQDAAFDPVRSHPKFQKFLRKLGLAETAYSITR